MRTDRPEMPDADQGLDDPNPGPTHDMQRRLDDLPHGHPSSPYNEDGSRKPPETRWQDIESSEADEQTPPATDRPPPLTDPEHADHVHEVRSLLEKAHADGLGTDKQHVIDKDGEAWDKDRRIGHDSIIQEMYGRSADVPNEHRAIIAGGLGGSGKSTILSQYAGIDQSHYLTINPDIIKEEMAARGMIPQVDGLSPMEAADLVHEESSHIAKQLALRAQGDGKNLIWDITMSSQTTTDGRIDDLRAAGYTHVEGIFVDIPVEASVTRADSRHRQGHDDYRAGAGLGGRFVPAEVIERQADPEWGSVNRRTFEVVKYKFDRWLLYDNSTAGEAPVLADASEREEKDS